MAQLTVQQIKRSGLAPSYVAASAGGDTFAPSSDTFLHVKNASAGAITVTVVTPGNVLGDIAIADVSVSVPAGAERMIGPFPYEYFADPTDGLADITYSAVGSVTVAAIQVSKP